MAQVTFIIGGPGSGKTEEVVSRLARGYKDGRFWDVLLLAPTVRHGDQLRRRLVAKCSVAMGLGVESLSQFSQRLTASRAGQPRMAARSVVDELLVRIIRREVESGGASYFRPILRTRGLGRLVRASVLNLVSERADASRISRWRRGVQGCRPSRPWRPSIPPMSRSWTVAIGFTRRPSLLRQPMW